MGRNILVVEDDRNISDLIQMYLVKEGFDVRIAGDGGRAIEEFQKECPDLILLDIMLPGMDGMDVLKSVRKNSQVPVIMATAKGPEYDKVTGLDSGADDYLVKPFSMIEMVSRVRAVLRRTTPKPVSALTYGKLSMNTAGHTVALDEATLELTLKEYELLRLFLEHPGQVFTREQLLEQIWETEFFGETRTVDVHIGTLRSKLGPLGNVIRTVRGVG